jgi:hypothetical protein
LVDRASERVDTIKKLKGFGGEGFKIFRPRGSEMTVVVGSNPLASTDQAILLPDGWIALARLDPYRIDWRTPQGVWKEGSPIPHDVIEATERERCAAMEAWGGPFRPCDTSLLPAWPEKVPAFPADRPDLKVLLAGPGGDLVVARTWTAESTHNVYDVVNRDGRLVRRLEMPPNQTLIGFGKGSAYTVTVDEFDLQTLMRHPWPR